MDDVRTLNKRYETAAWGAFFILLGVTGLLPGIPAGVGTIGIGLILLGLNLARYLSKLPTSGFTVTLGVIALVLGTVEVLEKAMRLDINLPFFPILLITIGVIWLIRGATRRT